MDDTAKAAKYCKCKVLFLRLFKLWNTLIDFIGTFYAYFLYVCCLTFTKGRERKFLSTQYA